jgi:D-proline reductase (dithiol) PrdB
VTTAGVHLRGEENFFLSDATYRVIPAGASPGDVVMSHASVNFDRTGFQEDLNVVLPLTRFEELASTGAIASVANFHYSFMGAGLEPAAYESTACQLAGLMKRDGVNTVFLTPV